MEITPELIEEIKAKAEAPSMLMHGFTTHELFRRTDILALVAALEEAQRERDAAVKAHNECVEWLKESEAARDLALNDALVATAAVVRERAERDALRAENVKLRAALRVLTDAVGRYQEIGPLKGVRNDLAKGLELGLSALDPDLGRIKPGHVCKHGIRWPHACGEWLSDFQG